MAAIMPNAPVSSTSPLEGEVDARSAAGEGVSPQTPARAERPPPPAPPPRGGREQKQHPRRDRRDVQGWVVLDKPIGLTSTHAVAIIKRLFSAKRAGHAG